jgi:hypothetical protein
MQNSNPQTDYDITIKKAGASNSYWYFEQETKAFFLSSCVIKSCFNLIPKICNMSSKQAVKK